MLPSFGSMTVTDGSGSRMYRSPSGPASMPGRMASFVWSDGNYRTTANGSAAGVVDGAGDGDGVAATGSIAISAASAYARTPCASPTTKTIPPLTTGGPPP